MSNQPPNNPNISFKTVPGRNRTQKWNKAPAYNYDGDDWGGYDPYDEYGQDEPPPPMPAPAPAPHAPQHLPSQQSLLPRVRNNSFDRGDETRQFSSSTATSAFPPYEERRPSRGAAPTSASSTARGSNDIPRSTSRPRDFTNPEQAPPPLVTRDSPAPTEWFPPRKSSLQGGTYETAAAASEARAIAASVAHSSSPSTDKPLPFIRPSDIYKRIPEEMRRQSEDGSRPSMDSLQRELSPPQSALTPVTEVRESRLLMDADMPKVEDKAGNVDAGRIPARARQSGGGVSPTLPDLQRFSGFGDDFLSGGTSSNPRAGRDPAAEILAERQHAVPVNAIAGQDATALQHQPSQGFRSAVHQAFDNTAPISRDSSQSGPTGSSVSRSDTTSTAGISPIMSRVPSGATAQMRQQQQTEDQVPSIAEESSITPTTSRQVSGPYAAHSIPRKPSPGRSGDMSAPTNFEPGYRRSLDPPSTGSSPARTPGLETAPKRLSSAMSAVTMTQTEAPDVVDQGAEIPGPSLHQAETPASEMSGFDAPTKPLPIAGRGRSGTDYSIREADIVEMVNASPDEGLSLPAIAQAQRESQKEFLESHATPISETNPAARDGIRSQTGTPTYGSRAGSPAKGRVREIADKYHEIHSASRRNSSTSMHSSKSSWSQFDKPGLSRQGTAQSPTGVEAVADDRLGSKRPEIGREESFRPDMPGGWVSAAPTPSLESPPVEPSRAVFREATTPQPETPVDLTPTTRKYKLQAGPVTPGEADSSKTAFESVKTAGEQLGASLLSTVGIGHQTRDFASTQPAAPVDQPETRSRPAIGEQSILPPLMRLQSDSTDATASVASSVAPTPPAKDTSSGNMLGVSDGHGGYFNTVAPLRIRSREASPEHLQSSAQIPVLPALSTSRHASDMDSDRLRKEIVRSLDPSAPDETPRASMDDIKRTPGPIAGLSDSYTTEQGLSATSAAAVEANPSKPGLLTTRFSWENAQPSGSTARDVKPSLEPEPASPEIKPEMAYERPRSSVLHVVNAAVSPISPEDASPAAHNTLSPGPMNSLGGAVSPITKSQEHLLPDSTLHAGSPARSLTDLAPSPMSDSVDTMSTRLPSYYLGAHDNDHEHDAEVVNAPEKVLTNSSTMSQQAQQTQQAKTNAPIPPFRNILSLKTAEERIKTYNETRETFADMNTGLSDWLAKMLEYHPEHAGIPVSGAGFKPPALQTQTSGFKRGHKTSPSIAKFTDQFRSVSGGQRTASGAEAEPTPAGASSDSPRVDMDKMQQRGKEFMKNASVLGGKASSGAKGLFAKGKSRFAGGSVRGKSGGNYEAPPPPPALPTTTTTGAAALSTTTTGAERPATAKAAAVGSPLVIATSAKPSTMNGEDVHSHTTTPVTAIPVTDATEIPVHDVPTPIPVNPPATADPPTTITTVPTPRSQTPSSSRTSKVFERLRGASRSRSRPTSLVLPNSEKEEGGGEFVVKSVRSTRDDRPSHQRSYTAPNAQGARRAMSVALPLRTEMWNEEGVEVPPVTPKREGRLGILPSPVPTVITFEELREGAAAKRRSLNAGSGVVGGGLFREDVFGQELGRVDSEGAEEVEEKEPPKPKVIRTGSDLATLPSLRPSTAAAKTQSAWLREDDASPPEIPQPQGRYFIANAVPRDQQVSPENEEPAPVRRHQRRVSDLAMLPSMRQHSPLNIGRPDSEVLVPLRLPSQESLGAEEISPVTVKQRSPMEGTPVVAKGIERDELYDVTPIASKVPEWRPGSTGHEREIEQMEREMAAIAGAEPTTSEPSQPDISRPTTSETFNDARSEVSAEEGAVEEEPRHMHNNSRPNLTTSRHSSVSSLGEPEKAMLGPGTAEPTLMSDEARRLVMSAQAIPAGPSREEVNRQEQFANRLYAERRTESRPLSYAPLPPDQEGLIREEITTGVEPVNADLGSMSGPAGGAVLGQQYPVLRGQPVVPDQTQQAPPTVQPIEYEQLRPLTAPGHTPQASVDSSKTKRQSGFFRLRKNTLDSTPPATTSYAPAPSKIGDNHGLEDLHDSGTVAAASENMVSQLAPQQSQAEQKQARRGSGIWNTLTRRESRAGIRPDSSRESSLAPLDSRNERPPSRQLDKVREEPSKRNTLRKPQRATSDAVELEPKKKRFSKLGSLFGRSNTTASPPNASSKEPPKATNRLSKKNQNGAVRRSETMQEPRAMGFGTVPGNVSGYEAYERIRQRYDVPAFQETQAPNAQAPSTPSNEGVQPPADGWYGPSSREAEIRPSTTPAPRPDFRRLHSSGPRHRSVNQVPEAFRPVPASFEQPVEPIGPPPGHEPPFRVMSPEQMMYAQGGRPVAHRVPTGSPSVERSRQLSDVSMLSRPISGQEGSVSPLTGAYTPPRERRVTLGDGGAYGRPTPPPGLRRGSSYDSQGYPTPFEGAPLPRQRGPPSSSFQPQSQGAYPPGQRHASIGSAPPRRIPWEDTQPARTTQAGPYPPPAGIYAPPPTAGLYSPPPPPPPSGPYPPPPRSFTAPERYAASPPASRGPQYPPPPGQHIYHQQQQRAPPQNRYYAHHQGQPSPPGPPDPFSPPRQRRMSGYTGRRDDPTVGEEDLIMRGASYPGQEWAPEGLSREWD